MIELIVIEEDRSTYLMEGIMDDQYLMSDPLVASNDDSTPFPVSIDLLPVKNTTTATSDSVPGFQINEDTSNHQRIDSGVSINQQPLDSLVGEVLTDFPQREEAQETTPAFLDEFEIMERIDIRHYMDSRDTQLEFLNLIRLSWGLVLNRYALNGAVQWRSRSNTFVKVSDIESETQQILPPFETDFASEGSALSILQSYSVSDSSDIPFLEDDWRLGDGVLLFDIQDDGVAKSVSSVFSSFFPALTHTITGSIQILCFRCRSTTSHQVLL
jgi:hypothetical protein